MRAAVVRAPGVLEVTTADRPGPGPYQALCEILWGATCTGTDSHIIDGVFPFSSPFPTILGHESVGRVVELGPNVVSYRLGDLVTRVGAPAMPAAGLSATWGGFAEYGLAWDHWAMRHDGLPREAWDSHRVNQVLHPLVRPRDAPMFTTWRETLSYARRLGLKGGDQVLITGSGGNGLAFATHARNLGASRIVMVGSPAAEPTARRAGVTDFVDYGAADLEERLREAVGRELDVVIDAVGRQGSTSLGLPHLKDGGVVAVYGMDDHGRLSLDLARAAGTFVSYNGGYDEAETHEEVTARYLEGALDAAIWLGGVGVFDLDDIAGAFGAVRARRSPKALVRILG